MDSSRLSEWSATFSFFDRDKDGFISQTDSLIALRQIAPNATPTDLRRSLSSKNADDASTIDFPTFVRFLKDSLNIQATSSPQVTVADIRAIFQTMDLDFSGYLTAAKIRHFFTNLDIHVDDAQMADMVRMYDTDGNVLQDDLPDAFEAVEDASDVSIESSVNTDQVPVQVDRSPSNQISLDSLPPYLRNALKSFDLSGSELVNLEDLQCAADLLRTSKSSQCHSMSALRQNARGGEVRGLGEYVHQVNHIALIVSDVGKSDEFYSNVMGFRQIRRPNFDAQGAWFTMGNIELHLIKGIPAVHSGDDLIVNHISIETEDIDKIPDALRRLGVPFEQSVSVPKGKDGGGLGTNTSNSSDKNVKQYFIRDPDGYYIEICNCDVLTDYCLGDASVLDGYQDVEALSLMNAAVCVNLMQKWSDQGQSRLETRKKMISDVARKDGSWKEIACLFGCSEVAYVDDDLLQNFMQRRSIYGEICQNESKESLEEILRLSGNDAYIANEIISIKVAINGFQTIQPPPFYKDGYILINPPPIKIIAKS